MSAKKPSGRKRRTREHVIADLSANHVERHALYCGYSVQRVTHDYGIDLLIATYNRFGEFENGEIRVQLKATDSPRWVSEGQTAALRISQQDLRHWLLEPMPVMLVLYDAQNDAAYWIYIQAYFESRRGFDFAKGPGSVTVHVPRENLVDPAALTVFAQFRDKLLAQLKGVTHHE